MNRHILSLLAAAIMAAPVAHAQAMGGMSHQHADSVEHAQMMANLNLTADQQFRIDAIHKKYAMQMKQGHNSTGMAGKESMHGSDSTMKKGMAEVRAVLTPAQQAKFDGMMEEHMKQRAKADSSAHNNMKMPPGSTPS